MACSASLIRAAQNDSFWLVLPKVPRTADRTHRGFWPLRCGRVRPRWGLRSFGARGERARGRRARRRALQGSPAATLERSFRGIELLDEVLRASGPPGLMGLAADFALARFDLEQGVLTLARDAFGLRPLYWAKVGRRFAFASDVSVLQHLGLASADLDPAVVAGYLARFGVPRGRTGFKDVFCVPPGSWLSVVLNGRASEGRWFDPVQLAVDASGRMRRWRQHARRSWPLCDHARSVTWWASPCPGPGLRRGRVGAGGDRDGPPLRA